MRERPRSRLALLAIIILIAEIVVVLESRRLHAQMRHGAEIDYERLSSDFGVMSEFARMMAFAESTPHEDEIAAFLVRDQVGQLSIVRWPVNGNQRTETWRGPIPRGTIAVVHTHPNGWSKPSPGDHRESARVGLPFIVLTRWDIWVAEPDERHALPIIKRVNWTDETHLASLVDNDEDSTEEILLARELEKDTQKTQPVDTSVRK